MFGVKLRELGFEPSGAPAGSEAGAVSRPAICSSAKPVIDQWGRRRRPSEPHACVRADRFTYQPGVPPAPARGWGSTP